MAFLLKIVCEFRGNNVFGTQDSTSMIKLIYWVSFFYEISFENMEKSEVEKPIFRRGGGVKFDPPLVLKGLKQPRDPN